MVDAVARAALTIGGAFFFGPIGGIVGGILGNFLFPVQLADVKGPRLSELNVQRSTVGAPITIVYGTKRVGGNIIFASDLIEVAESEEQGGKGGGTSQTVTTYSYFADLRIGICDGEDGRPSKPQGIRRIWAYSDLIYDRSPQGVDETDEEYTERLATSAQTESMMTIYPGDEDQLASPMIESYKGVGNVPGYRGLYSVEFEQFPLNKYGKAIPQFTFEVYTGTAVEESCTEYSAGVMYPWACDNDPRDSRNTHVYAGQDSSYTDFTLTIEEAAAQLGGTGWNPNIIHGWSASSTPNTEAPCSACNTELVRAFAGINKFSATGPYICDVPNAGNGGDSLLQAVGDQVLVHWDATAGGAGTGYQPGFFYLTEGKLTIGEATAITCPDLMSGSVQLFTTDGLYRRVCRRSDQEVAIKRVLSPPDECLGGTPISGAEGFCIVNGEVHRSLEWTLTAGTYKAIAKYDETGPFGSVTSYPVDPCLPLGDPNYDSQAFWEAAYADALADGAPLVDPGWTYGVEYPAVLSQAFVGECAVTAVTPDCVPMAQIVADICDRAGLATDTGSQIDVTGLTTCVTGYGIGRQMPARDALTPLRMFGLWDCVESEGVLKFIERGGAIAASITSDELAVHEAGDGREPPSIVETARIQEKDLPRRIRLHYEDIDRNHEPGEQSASRLSTLATNELDIDLAISMTADEAAPLAEVLLYDFWTSRNSYRIQVDHSHSRLEPSDVIEIPVDGETERVRIVSGERSLGGIIRLEAVRDDDGDYVSTAVPTEHDPSGPQGHDSDVLVCPSEMVLLDIPRLRDGDIDAGYYAAIYGTCDTWECAAVYRSVDGGLTYGRIARTDKQATVGEIAQIDATGLPTEPPDLSASPIPYDAISAIQVNLSTIGATLSSVIDEQILAGANAAAIGIHGRWVIIQYKTATLISGDLWELTDILWGVNDTIQNVGTTVAGDSFVLLNENLIRISESCDNVGVDRQLKAVTCGEAVDDVTAQNFTTQGLSCERVCPSTVISASLTSPPISNADGDAYLLPNDTSLEGVWLGHGGEIAHWSADADSWIFCTPAPGTIVTILDELDDSSGGSIISDGDGGYSAAPWTPAIPPLSVTGDTSDIETGYFVIYTPAGYRKVLGSDVATGGGSGATSLDGLTDVEITAPAENDVLVYDGTSGLWVNEPQSTGISGMAFVGKVTVTGSAATSMTVGGLSINTHGSYFCEYISQVETGSAATHSLYLSGDTTNGNYNTILHGSIGGSDGATRNNNAVINTNTGTAGDQNSSKFHIRRQINGSARAMGHTSRRDGSNFGEHLWVVQSAVMSDVTSITIQSSVANSLAVGSTLWVWAIGE